MTYRETALARAKRMHFEARRDDALNVSVWVMGEATVNELTEGLERLGFYVDNDAMLAEFMGLLVEIDSSEASALRLERRGQRMPTVTAPPSPTSAR